MPMNVLLLESLRRLYHYYGDTLQVEFPKDSGNMLNLHQVSIRLSERLASLFLPQADGVSPPNPPANNPLKTLTSKPTKTCKQGDG